MRKRSSLLLLMVLGAALLYRNRHRTSLQRIRANVRAFDLPTAGMYDALVASVLSGLYERVADEVAASLPTGTVLEGGSGPGRLAVLLAQRAPGLEVVGVDISPEMVEHAARRAKEAGLGERVRFEVGDVGALPFPDTSFDGAVSTLSLHHWPDPARTLAVATGARCIPARPVGGGERVRRWGSRGGALAGVSACVRPAPPAAGIGWIVPEVWSS